jgi:hypothetical protein
MSTVSVPPLSPEFGLVDVTFGAETTVKALASEPVPPSELVTVTARAPVLAPDSIEIFVDSSVELTKLVDSTVMPAPNDAPAPPVKPVPLIAIVCLLAPWLRELGLVDATVGGASTVKTPVPVALVVSGFVTVTLRTPVLAFDAIVTFALTSVELTKLVEFTVTPVPENEAASPVPFSKFVPLIATVWLLAP